ncbi:MAG: hypothetical protein ACFFDN_17175 [Candidatus Hodarchaeota archaeon]
MAISKKQEVSGIISRGGFKYQDISVAHKMIVLGWDKVYYERGGADYIYEYYDENRRTNIISFIQCKTQETGAFYYKKYVQEVLPIFAKIYKSYEKKRIKLKFILETNTVLHQNLKKFFKNCIEFANNTISSIKFKSNIGGRSKVVGLQKLSHLTESNLLRFLKGLSYVEKQSLEEMALEILNVLEDIFLFRAKEKFEQLLGIIYIKDQELITKEELEKELSGTLKVYSRSKTLKFYSQKVQDVLKISSTTTLDEKVNREISGVFIEDQLKKLISALEIKQKNITNDTLAKKMQYDIDILKSDTLTYNQDISTIKELEQQIEAKETAIIMKRKRAEEIKEFWNRIDEKKFISGDIDEENL